MLKGIFGGNKTKAADWVKVERDATATLFAYYKTDPDKISTIMPRLLLLKDCTLEIHNDERNPKHMFGCPSSFIVSKHQPVISAG